MALDICAPARRDWLAGDDRTFTTIRISFFGLCDIEEEAMGFEQSKWVWMNGKLIPWSRASIHVSVHALHYGSGVFEGVRCYQTDDGPSVFRLDDHLNRLYASAEVYVRNSVHTGRAGGGDLRINSAERIFGLLRASHLLFRQRWPRSKSASVSGRVCNSGLAMGAVSWR